MLSLDLKLEKAVLHYLQEYNHLYFYNQKYALLRILVYDIFQSLFQQYHLQFGDISISLLLFLVTFLLEILILLLVCSGSESKNNYSFLLNPFPTKLINYLPLLFLLPIQEQIFFQQWAFLYILQDGILRQMLVQQDLLLQPKPMETISFIRINFKRDFI